MSEPSAIPYGPTKPLTTMFSLAKCFSMQQTGLRRICEAHMELVGTDENALKHVSLVGARFRSQNVLSGMDRDILYASFQHLLEAGIVINPDFEIDVVNFEYGRDFLAEDTPTDLVLGCYIFDTRPSTLKAEEMSYVRHFNASMAYQRGEAEAPVGCLYFDNETSTIRSPHSFRDTAWYDRISAADAKVVVNNSPVALSTDRFTGEGYKTITYSPFKNTERYSDKDYDFLFKDEFYAAVQPSLKSESRLTQKLSRSSKHGAVYGL